MSDDPGATHRREQLPSGEYAPIPQQQPPQPLPQQQGAAPPSRSPYGSGTGGTQPTVPAGYGQAAPASAPPQQSASSGYGPAAHAWGEPPRKPGFFRALVDLSYDHYATPSVVKVVQVVVMVLSGLTVLSWPVLLLLDGQGAEGAALAILALVVGLVIWLLVNVAVRVGLELAVAGIKTAENTEELVQLARAQRREQQPRG